MLPTCRFCFLPKKKRKGEGKKKERNVFCVSNKGEQTLYPKGSIRGRKCFSGLVKADAVLWKHFLISVINLYC
jgi:hypothetical protein